MIKKIFVFLLFGISVSCKSPKVYLVRHAEKSTSPANDPLLTETGLQRAQDLAAVLASKKIQAIYSTKTTRTRSTAEPLSKKAGIAITYYAPDTAVRIAERALKQRKNTLIVGHSNTLLPLIKQLGLQPSLQEIKESDYDNLFIIRMKHGKLQVLEKSYGLPTPAGEISMK